MRLVALLTAVSLSGCFYLTKEDRVRSIEIRTIPYGASVSTSDGEGSITLRGEAPVVVQTRYTAFIRRFRHWAWIWPGLSVAGTAGGLAIAQSAESRKGSGNVLAAFSAIGVLVTSILCIIGELESGKLKSTNPESLIVVTGLPGRPQREHKVSLIATGSETTLSALPPSSRPATLDGEPTHPPIPRGTVIAVFDLDDLTGQLAGDDGRRLTEQLTTRVFAEGLRVVAHERLRAWLVRRGIGRCYPGTCQTAAARAMSAQKALATKLRRTGQGCAITARLYDIWSGMAERTTSTRTDCSVNALMGGMERIADQLAAGD